MPRPTFHRKQAEERLLIERNDLTRRMRALAQSLLYDADFLDGENPHLYSGSMTIARISSLNAALLSYSEARAARDAIAAVSDR